MFYRIKAIATMKSGRVIYWDSPTYINKSKYMKKKEEALALLHSVITHMNVGDKITYVKIGYQYIDVKQLESVSIIAVENSMKFGFERFEVK